MIDLELATTDQLIGELSKRYPLGLVVVGSRVGAEDSCLETKTEYRGCTPMALGLATVAVEELREASLATVIDAWQLGDDELEEADS